MFLAKFARVLHIDHSDTEDGYRRRGEPFFIHDQQQSRIREPLTRVERRTDHKRIVLCNVDFSIRLQQIGVESRVHKAVPDAFRDVSRRAIPRAVCH